MSDFKGIEITDVFGLKEPLIKLIETISYAVGKIFEPTHNDRMTKSKAKEIRDISEALRENNDIIITYDKGSVIAETPEFEDFVRRTQQRLAYQELEKQCNIESVVGFAYTELETIDNVSNEPVDKDWISRFFNCVEDASNEDLQRIWGKILAGEIKKPKSFSKRTLDVVKNLSQQEAQIFEKISKYVLHTFEDETKIESVFVLSGMFNKSKNEDVDVIYKEILVLKDAGLISLTHGTVLSFDFDSGEIDSLFCHNKEIRIKNNTKSKVSIMIHPYILTDAGKELVEVLYDNEQVSMAYLNRCICEIRSSLEINNKNDIDIKII